MFERCSQIVSALLATPAPEAAPPSAMEGGPLGAPVPAHVAFFARRVVTQGGVLIEKQPAAAVPLALVVAAAASALPAPMGGALWRAVLGELAAACPFTLPCFPPRGEGESTEQWKLKLGYKNLAPSPGAVRLEAKDKYYSRVCGFVSLHAALFSAQAYMDFELGAHAARTATPRAQARCGWGARALTAAHSLPPALPSAAQAAAASTAGCTRRAQTAARARPRGARSPSRAPTAASAPAWPRRGAGWRRCSTCRCAA